MRTTSRAARRPMTPPRESTAPSALEQYLREVRRYPTVPREEEMALARRMRAGDDEALQALVNANLRFVVSVAKRFQHRGVPLDDLVSEGNLGLLRAAERFDETKGVRFLSYAVWWIRQGVLQALRQQPHVVRMPTGAIPAPGAWREISLDAPVGAEDDTTVGEVVADESTPAPDERAASDGSRRALSRVLSRLTSRDAAIVRMHFGLDKGGMLTTEEIAVRVAIEPSQVRERLKAALAYLQRSAASGVLEAVT